VFSSCSHIGADNVLRLVSAALGGSRIYAFVGGLHLFRSDEKEAMRVAERLANSDLKLLVTGHCTGETALELLNERMGERLLVTYPGMTAEL
jgi:7,8-dihydropterin-6-yl-methyl-4-(beta-D-ribofuranosyl)aminobenzene 5'-phosphate synthase